jgi:uncharacterized phage protein gp47/JayE
VPNSVLRVVSDAMGALCHLTLQYLDWLALQLMPDTAETEWLDRHGQIWLVNADGSTGRKLATPATGEAAFTTSADSTFVPSGTQLSYANGVDYMTTADISAAFGVPTNAPVTALDPGSAGNLDPGTTLALVTDIQGIADVSVVSLTGGTNQETDDELRGRVLQRIREPPMGGDADDYEQWALSYPGVTRAWCYPLEMGIGTVTVRFMMDDLRAEYNGFPLPQDVDGLAVYLDTVRPVAVKDFFVEAPIAYPVNLQITYVDPDTAAVRNAITQSLLNQFLIRSQPGQTWYRAWSDEGIMGAVGVNAYDLDAGDVAMPSPGHMPVLGDLTYGALTGAGLRLG